MTGVYYFSFGENDQSFTEDWIPRSKENKWIDRKALETIILGYEQRLFGKKYTEDGARIISRKDAKNIDRNFLSRAPSVNQGQCYSTCVSYYCGDWYCEYYVDWGQEDKWIPPHGGSGDGGSLPLPPPLNDDFLTDVDSDTTDINCSSSELKEWEKAWCESSPPQGIYLTRTKNALNNIEQRGSE